MEGLKNMVANAMGDDGPMCVQCGKWIEPGNTGTVCGACTQSMLGMGNPFQPLSGYAANPNDYGASNLTPNSHVGLTINGHNLNVTAYRSLQGLADDITNSMLPDQVAMLVKLLSPIPGTGIKPSNDLPDEFWQYIKEGMKIRAIKELRAASTLGLRASKDIVDAIMNKDQDESKDKPDSEDKPEDKDDSGKDESESDGQDDGDEFDPDDYGPDDYEEAMADQGEDDGEFDPAGEPYGSDALGGDREVSAAEAEVTDEAPKGDTATAEALGELARAARDNGKDYSEDEIKAALATLGIQF